jgi:hypothetical protein
MLRKSTKIIFLLGSFILVRAAEIEDKMPDLDPNEEAEVSHPEDRIDIKKFYYQSLEKIKEYIDLTLTETRKSKLSLFEKLKKEINRIEAHCQNLFDPLIGHYKDLLSKDQGISKKFMDKFFQEIYKIQSDFYGKKIQAYKGYYTALINLENPIYSVIKEQFSELRKIISNEIPDNTREDLSSLFKVTTIGKLVGHQIFENIDFDTDFVLVQDYIDLFLE